MAGPTIHSSAALLALAAALAHGASPPLSSQSFFSKSRPRLHRVRTKVEYSQYVTDLMAYVLAPSAAYAEMVNSSAPMLRRDGSIAQTHYKVPQGLTMQTPAQLHGLRAAIEQIIEAGVPGDIVETGTWRAGTALFMVGVVQAYEALLAARVRASSSRQRLSAATPLLAVPRARHFWFFDSFEGFGHMGLQSSVNMELHLNSSMFAAPLDRVTASFDAAELFGPRVHFVKGFFEKTVPAFGRPRQPLALLRLDGDLYSSTMIVLQHFYPAVAEGGWVVIDDYNWFSAVRGTCRAAIDTFRAEHNITSPIRRNIHLGGAPSWVRRRAMENVEAD